MLPHPNAMIVFAPKESDPKETRAAMNPDTAKRMIHRHQAFTYHILAEFPVLPVHGRGAINGLRNENRDHKAILDSLLEVDLPVPLQEDKTTDGLLLRLHQHEKQVLWVL